VPLTVHSALPDPLTRAVGEVLGAEHVAHGDRAPLRAVEALAPVPVVAFDGVQGAVTRPVHLALPVAPVDGVAPEDLYRGVESARRAARLVAEALQAGATSRSALLAELRARGPFDEHGDPVDPPVWLWRAGPDGRLEPDRPL
jgi:hypothetical protein